MIIDGMMHLEVSGAYWDGLIEEVLRHYDAAGIDKGVVLTTWTPSRQSNDRTMRACRAYPNRFIPFGHVRPVDTDWQDELKRITQEFGWTGLKLHQGELKDVGPDLKATARMVVEQAADLGIQLVKIHLEDYDAVEELSRTLPQVTWILPHMGCYREWREMPRYCALAHDRANVYLDTSCCFNYPNYGRAFLWAGVEKITFASDGHQFSPLVEKAKIDTLRLPTPFQTPTLTKAQYDLIMGGNMARLLGMT